MIPTRFMLPEGGVATSCGWLCWNCATLPVFTGVVSFHSAGGVSGIMGVPGHADVAPRAFVFSLPCVRWTISPASPLATEAAAHDNEFCCSDAMLSILVGAALVSPVAAASRASRNCSQRCSISSLSSSSKILNSGSLTKKVGAPDLPWIVRLPTVHHNRFLRAPPVLAGPEQIEPSRQGNLQHLS